MNKHRREKISGGAEIGADRADNIILRQPKQRRRYTKKHVICTMIFSMCLVSCAGREEGSGMAAAAGTEMTAAAGIEMAATTGTELVTTTGTGMAATTGTETVTTAVGIEKETAAKSPELSVETAMKALKELDFTTFNAYTDNYLELDGILLGLPDESLYQIFSELQKYSLSKRERDRKKYEESHRIAEKIVEHLAWEIEAVKIQGEQAEIGMVITNKDLSDVMGYYTIQMMERMIAGDGAGLTKMVQDLSEMYLDDIAIINYIEKTEDTRTVNLIVTAWKEEGRWRLHLSDELIGAVTGDFNNEDFSEEVQTRIDRLEQDYEKKIEQWGDELEERIEDRLNHMFEGW